MKIYDISQEVFSSIVYSGDRAPERMVDKSIDEGDLYNLTSFTMCAHNGTHIDAPYHFINSGNTVDKLPLAKTLGYCYVATVDGDVTADVARTILNKASLGNRDASKRILIKGQGIVMQDAAEVLSKAGIDLVGVELQTVGMPESPMATHMVFLSSEVVLLEGLRLADIVEGEYFLCAQPLNLAGADGAPCRAILIGE